MGSPTSARPMVGFGVGAGPFGGLKRDEAKEVPPFRDNILFPRFGVQVSAQVNRTKPLLAECGLLHFQFLELTLSSLHVHMEAQKGYVFFWLGDQFLGSMLICAGGGGVRGTKCSPGKGNVGLVGAGSLLEASVQ